MSDNVQYKGIEYKSDTGYYDNNVTKTSNTYYLPTISDNSGTDNNVIIDNYLGNNGRLEIANQMLHVTKQLKAPEGYSLTDAQKDETFNYQIFVQGVTGTRSAVRTLYNEYSGTWECRLAYIDVLTDNSDLVQTNDNQRALFVLETTGDVNTAKQVLEGTDKEGYTHYYYADDDGNLPTDDDGYLTGEIVDSALTIYYLYLPSDGSGEEAQHTRRLYQDKEYNDTSYEGSPFDKNGTTTFFSEGQRTDETGKEPGANNRDSYRLNTGMEETRPAGTKTYWALDAELIPKETVDAVEAPTVDGELEASAVTPWTHATDGEHDDDHKELTFFTFVIRKPNDETSMTNFTSPFKTRTMYLTLNLEFGKNANENDSSNTGPLEPGDLYDTVIPSTDRPDLFIGDNANANYIAAHTAEFTLKHNEGLLLTGLDNRVAYRFTEKLTTDQLEKGYTLKEVSHVQQRGSLTTYVPGSNSFTDLGFGAEYGSLSESETFYHTNAKLVESYSTMTSADNHHDPGKNPACVGDKADEKLADGSIRHYFVKDGDLVDKHYDGEDENLKDVRYVVNPTAHFGVEDEPEEPIVTTANAQTDYTGVYSVFGNTGWFEEQVNYTNTFEPGNLTITKKLETEAGTTLTDADKATKFDFTLKLDVDGGVGNPDGVYNYTITGGGENVKGRLLPSGMTEGVNDNDIVAGSDGTWAFKLKGDQTMTVTGLPVDSEYTYTVTEVTAGDGYIVTDSDEAPKSNTDKTITGTVEPGDNPAALEFTNTKKKPEPVTVDLPITKNITEQKDDFNWENQAFQFLVTPSEGNPTDGDPINSSTEGWSDDYGGLIVTISNPDVLNGKTGTAKVLDGIKFEKAGKYVYTVSEIKGNIPGIKYSDKGYTVTITVEEDYGEDGVYTGNLKATKTISPGSELIFDNPYNKDEVTVPIKAKKELTGRALEENEFEFELTYVPPVSEIATIAAGDSVPLPSVPSAAGSLSVFAKNAADGTIDFGEITFTAEGTYTYTLHEVVKESGDTSIKYDPHEYTIVIEIGRDENGVLTCKNVTVSGVPHTSDYINVLNFTNEVITTGDLSITKTVEDNGGNKNEAFDFTLTVVLPEGMEMPEGVAITKTDTVGTVEGETLAFKSGVLTFTLKNGETLTITGLPIGTSYTVKEDDYSGEFYSTTYNGSVNADGAEGSITLTPSAVNVTNTKNVGDLTVSKTVVNGDATKKFTFTVTLEEYNGKAVSGKFGEMEFTNGVATFKLNDGESKTATGLPAGIKYTVTEGDYTSEGYTTTSDGASSSIPSGGVAEAKFTNKKPDASKYIPTVQKLIDGTPKAGYTFTFKIEAVTPGAPMPDNETVSITLTDYDKLYSVSFGDIPFSDAGIYVYTITEETFDDSTDFVYDHSVWTLTVTVVPVGDHLEATGVYAKDGMTVTGAAAATFTNKRKSGDLTVSKTVTGDAGDTNKEFHFTVELSDKTITGTYGEMKFTDGVASFTLKHNGHATATGLPVGITYTVIETEAGADDYKTSIKDNDGTVTDDGKGTIEENGKDTVEFTNHKEKPKVGDLTVSKIVTGDGDKDKEWHFKVKFTPTVVIGELTITKYDAENNAYEGDVYTVSEDGDLEFTLKHGERIEIGKLPAGVTYTVTETEANANGYTTKAYGATGTIMKNGEATAEFINNKDESEHVTPPDEGVPLTGDVSRLGFWLTMLALSLSGILLTSIPLVGRRVLASGRRGSGRR